MFGGIINKQECRGATRQCYEASTTEWFHVCLFFFIYLKRPVEAINRTSFYCSNRARTSDPRVPERNATQKSYGFNKASVRYTIYRRPEFGPGGGRVSTTVPRDIREVMLVHTFPRSRFTGHSCERRACTVRIPLKMGGHRRRYMFVNSKCRGPCVGSGCKNVFPRNRIPTPHHLLPRHDAAHRR